MKKYIFFLLPFLQSINCSAGLNPYVFNEGIQGFMRGLEMGERAREAQIQRYLIEKEIAEIDTELAQIREEEIKQKNSEIIRAQFAQKMQFIFYHSVNQTKKAVKYMGGEENLSKAINSPLQDILNWIKGNSTPDAWACKRIEQATNGYIKAQDILPLFDFSTLR